MFRILLLFLFRKKAFITSSRVFQYSSSEASLRARLSKLYAEANVTRYEGIACFKCRKAAL